MQRTFVMIKANGVERALVGKIIKRIEKNGYKFIDFIFNIFLIIKIIDNGNATKERNKSVIFHHLV